MTARMKQMTGEQLLLLSVIRGPALQAEVDRVLDRRALLGPPEPAPTGLKARAASGRDGRLVA